MQYIDGEDLREPAPPRGPPRPGTGGRPRRADRRSARRRPPRRARPPRRQARQHPPQRRRRARPTSATSGSPATSPPSPASPATAASSARSTTSRPSRSRAAQIDARADDYSLACVLYECLAGVRPFDRDSELSVVFAHLNEPPPKLTDQRPDLPQAFDDLFATALAKNPDDRYQSCGELAAAARAALAGQVRAPSKPRRRRRLARHPHRHSSDRRRRRSRRLPPHAFQRQAGDDHTDLDRRRQARRLERPPLAHVGRRPKARHDGAAELLRADPAHAQPQRLLHRHGRQDR